MLGSIPAGSVASRASASSNRPRAVWMKAATVQIRQLNGGGSSRPPVRRMVVAAATSASTSSHSPNISFDSARHDIAWSTADQWLKSISSYTSDANANASA